MKSKENIILIKLNRHLYGNKMPILLILIDLTTGFIFAKI